MDARERVRMRFKTWVEDVTKRQRKYTQAQLAEMMGLRAQDSVSSMAKAGPRLEDLDAVARVMGVPIADLVAPEGMTSDGTPVRQARRGGADESAVGIVPGSARALALVRRIEDAEGILSELLLELGGEVAPTRRAIPARRRSG